MKPDPQTVVAAALIPRLDLFISLIGALASSCLAIIFPAIIETCTFWELESLRQAEHSHRQRLAQDGRARQHEQAADDEDDDDGPAEASAGLFGAKPSLKRRLALKRLLLVSKNLLLALFGLLGLITGGWQSLSQLANVAGHHKSAKLVT